MLPPTSRYGEYITMVNPIATYLFDAIIAAITIGIIVSMIYEARR